MEKYENLTAIIAENLVYYRKKAKLTQSELAAKLNYSDKSISKWERAEGVPDIHILVQLAKLYGLSVNDFVSKKKKEKVANRFFSKVLITLMAIGLVWLVAAIAFFAVRLIGIEDSTFFKSWHIFIYAIPVTCIVGIVFSSLYFNKWITMGAVSGLCWSLAVAIHIALGSYENMGLVYVVMAPFQVLVILFFVLLIKRKK